MDPFPNRSLCLFVCLSQFWASLTSPFRANHNLLCTFIHLNIFNISPTSAGFLSHFIILRDSLVLKSREWTFDVEFSVSLFSVCLWIYMYILYLVEWLIPFQIRPVTQVHIRCQYSITSSTISLSVNLDPPKDYSMRFYAPPALQCIALWPQLNCADSGLIKPE